MAPGVSAKPTKVRPAWAPGASTQDIEGLPGDILPPLGPLQARPDQQVTASSPGLLARHVRRLVLCSSRRGKGGTA